MPRAPRKPADPVRVEIPPYGPDRLNLMVDMLAAMRHKGCPDCGGIWQALEPCAAIGIIANVMDQLAERGLKRQKKEGDQ